MYSIIWVFYTVFSPFFKVLQRSIQNLVLSVKSHNSQDLLDRGQSLQKFQCFHMFLLLFFKVFNKMADNLLKFGFTKQNIDTCSQINSEAQPCVKKAR